MRAAKSIKASFKKSWTTLETTNNREFLHGNPGLLGSEYTAAKGAQTVGKKKLLLILVSLVLSVIMDAGLVPAQLLPGLGPPFEQPGSLLVLLLVVAVGVVWLLATIRRAHGRDEKLRRSSSAEQILRERYARGEMNRAQFAQIRNDLRSDLSPNL
jgi:uncharacterized membrane protein